MGDFRNLKVWKDTKDIAVEIYKLTEDFKDYSLKDQLRRASVSISSNIAEGDERFSNKESIRFLYIANGSVAELVTQLIIANEIGYIKDKTLQYFLNKLNKISKQIKSLIKYRTENDKP